MTRTSNLLRIEDIRATVLDDSVKGLPGGVTPFPLGDIGRQGWNVVAEDLPLPLMVLKQSAVENNLAVMQRYCERHGVALAPHGKTSMAPQLFAAQLAHGAWGITAASVEQLQVYHRFGVQTVMLANQLIGKPNLDYVARELAADPDFVLYSWVDSPFGVEALADVHRSSGLTRPFEVLVELGYAGGRAGLRDEAALDEVLAALSRHGAAVRLVGVAGFEGLFDHARRDGAPSRSDDLMSYLERMAKTATTLHERGQLPDDYIITAGGSSGFDAVVDTFVDSSAPPAVVLLRSGCYVTHDDGLIANSSPLAFGNSAEATIAGALQPALELWAYVQSMPESGLALLTFGRRDAPFDHGLPVPLVRRPAGSSEVIPLRASTVVAVNDQHAYLRHDEPLAVGDRVVLGISHPCTAFDKWRLLPVVDSNYDVMDGVLTFF